MNDKIINILDNLDVKETESLLHSHIETNVDKKTISRIKSKVYKKTGIKQRKNQLFKSFAAVLALVLLLSTAVAIAIPKLTDERIEYYDKKVVEINKENEAIKDEYKRISKLINEKEKEDRLNALREREIKFKEESNKVAEEAKFEGYIEDKDILDSIDKLMKKLEGLKKMKEWDIRRGDEEEVKYNKKQLKKIEKLLDEVNKSDESSFADLLSEYNKMIEDFKKERKEFIESIENK